MYIRPFPLGGCGRPKELGSQSHQECPTAMLWKCHRGLFSEAAGPHEFPAAPFNISEPKMLTVPVLCLRERTAHRAESTAHRQPSCTQFLINPEETPRWKECMWWAELSVIHSPLQTYHTSGSISGCSLTISQLSLLSLQGYFLKAFPPIFSLFATMNTSCRPKGTLGSEARPRPCEL